MKNTVILYDVHEERWLEFSRPVELVVTHDLKEVQEKLLYLEKRVTEEGLFAAGFISYEASPAFDACLPSKEKSGVPLIWFGLYPKVKKIDPPHLERELSKEIFDWSSSVTKEAYDRALAGVKTHIARGDTYQVNYTVRLTSPFDTDPYDFFLKLMQNHRREYAAFMDTGEYAVCSISPELFFRLDGNRLWSKPMKGTAARGMTLEEDRAQIEWLKNSVKNRAENVMIVDMIRNDMGRIAETGSVEVPRLFEVERYPTVLQMTTTVTAKTEASFCEILSALFPCSSITGAPKRRTMEIIDALETTPRGIYTGAIGFFAPERKAQFNVAIRTVLIDRKKKSAEYGVGGGIVWDSDTREEYEECRIKAKVLTREHKRFSLLETILFCPHEGYFLLEEHLDRLAGSAVYFDFDFDRKRIEEKLHTMGATLGDGAGAATLGDAVSTAAFGGGPMAGFPSLESPGKVPCVENTAGPSYKVRVLLSQEGGITCEAHALSSSEDGEPVSLAIATAPVDSSNPFLYHKTTRRDIYKGAKAARPDCDDVVLFNERGEVTETCIANIVARIGEKLFTPKVASGLLAGVFRGHLLKSGKIEEKVIDLETLSGCREIYLINSVRKWRRAAIEPGMPG